MAFLAVFVLLVLPLAALADDAHAPSPCVDRMNAELQLARLFANMMRRGVETRIARCVVARAQCFLTKCDHRDDDDDDNDGDSDDDDDADGNCVSAEAFGRTLGAALPECIRASEPCESMPQILDTTFGYLRNHPHRPLKLRLYMCLLQQVISYTTHRDCTKEADVLRVLNTAYSGDVCRADRYLG